MGRDSSRSWRLCRGFKKPERRCRWKLREGYVDHYSNVRLNSAMGYITPKDMLAARQQEIHAQRDRKLETARQQPQSRRHHAT